MATVEHLDLKQIAKLGMELYTRSIVPQLLPEDNGRYVAIDVHTGAYEVNAASYAAFVKLKEREPAAEVWLERVGCPTAIKFR